MHKFNRNDRVKIMRGKYKDKIAVVSEVEEHEDDDGYNYIVKGADAPFCLLIDEEFIESAPTVKGKNISLDHLNESANNKEEPRFRVGDVVIVVNDILHQYNDGIVQEVVAVDNGKSRHYEYHIAEFDRPLSGWDAYEESSVVFKYHDTQWEEYYTEMMNQHRKCVEQRELMEHVEQEPKPIKSFKKGNKVKAKSRFASGVGIIEHVTGEGEWAEYMITLQGENEPRIFYEKNLELIPLFDVGDVVNVEDDPNRVYVVNESILIGDEKNARYMYEVSSVYGDEDDIITCEESSLTFQYHDLIYEEYFTEGARQKGLPPWRGEFYNYFALCRKMGYDGFNSLNRQLCEEYNHDTIPPAYMQHILQEHSIMGALDDVIKGNRNDIKKSLGITDNGDLDNLSASIEHKFKYRNRKWADNIITGGDLSDDAQKDYSADEMRLIGQIDVIDKVKNNKDHYPICMTHYQIMDAIKEAYENAAKTSGRRKHPEVDKRNPEAGNVPVDKGAVEYEGYSSRYNLVIRFIYNFDLNCITTAFPIREERDVKKYNPESYHRKRFSE
jgi:hypothetical protein